jgi:hypothetical protein
MSSDALFTFDEDKLRRATPFALEATDLKGVFTIPPPPDDFDPNTASNTDLIRAGLPFGRPGRTASPAAHAAWPKMTSRPWRASDRIVPQFDVQTGNIHRLRRAPRRQADGTYLTDNWSDSAIGTGTWTNVWSMWNVPSVSRPSQPPGNSGSWISSTWVGLDGYDLFITSNDVLQAGVASSPWLSTERPLMLPGTNGPRRRNRTRPDTSTRPTSCAWRFSRATKSSAASGTSTI